MRKREPHEKIVIARVSRIASFKVNTLQLDGSCMTETGCWRVDNPASQRLSVSETKGHFEGLETCTYAATVPYYCLLIT